MAFHLLPSRTWLPAGGVALALVAAATFALAEDADPTGGYQLVWADEFDVDGPPQAAHWGFEQGFVRNQELQWYQPENAACAHGLLVIEGRRETRGNPGYDPDGRRWQQQRETIDYTSSCLITRGKHEWQYGRFEIRARVPARDGLWPAIWFLGRDGRWPDNGEIDLMEYYQGMILANAFWGGEKRGQPAEDVRKKPLSEFDDSGWGDRFHVWRMEWDEKRIGLYVDDELLNEIDLTRTRNPATRRGPENPFHQPHYLLVNLAIGGHAGGDPSQTSFPVRFEIDYVRVYQKK